MAIEYEARVRTVLVLTYPGLQKRRSFETGESELHVFASRRQCGGGVASFSDRGIERLASAIVSDLESPPFASWNAVEDTLAVIDPHWKVVG
jgi:hypothetical protein